MKNNKNEIDNEFKKLGLRHKKGLYSADLVEKKNPEINDGTLGINKASVVLNDLQNDKEFKENTNPDEDEFQKQTKILNKAIKQVKRMPKDSYAFQPKLEYDINNNYGLNTNDERQIANGKQPTAKDIRKNYIKTLNKKQRGLQKFGKQTKNLMTRTKYKGLNHYQLGKNLTLLENNEDNDLGTKHVYNMIKKDNIRSLDDINDDLHIGDDDLLSKREQSVSRETDKALDDPRYTYYVQAKPKLTGKNDFKPLSHQMVNKIATKSYKITKRDSKYIANKRQSLNKGKQQNRVLNKIGLKNPSNIKGHNQKHTIDNHKKLNVKQHTKNNHRHHKLNRNIERGPQI